MHMEDDRFKQLVEMLPQIVWVSDSDGNLEYVNEQWFRYTGITRRASNTAEAVEAIHPHDRIDVLKKWRRAVQAGQSFEAEMRLRRADGNYEWFLSRCAPVLESTTPDGGSGSEQGEISGSTCSADLQSTVSAAALSATSNAGISNGGTSNPSRSAREQKALRWLGTSTNIDRRKQTEDAQTFATELIARLRRIRNPEQIANILVANLGWYLGLDICLLLEYHTQTRNVSVLSAYWRSSSFDQQPENQAFPTIYSPDRHMSSNHLDDDPVLAVQSSDDQTMSAEIAGDHSSSNGIRLDIPDKNKSAWGELGEFLARQVENDPNPIILSDLTVDSTERQALENWVTSPLVFDVEFNEKSNGARDHHPGTEGAQTEDAPVEGDDGDVAERTASETGAIEDTGAIEKTVRPHQLNAHWMPAAFIAAASTQAWQGNSYKKVFLVGIQAAPRAWPSLVRNLFQTLAGSAWLAYQRAITEQSLRQQQTTLELALDMGRMGTWEYEHQRGLVMRSASLDRIFGLPYKDDARPIEDYYALIHPDDRAGVMEAVENSCVRGAPFDVEYRIMRPDGQLEWVVGRGALVEGNDGTAPRLSGALVDITERKELEAELHTRVQLAQFQAGVGTILTGSEDLRTLLQKCAEATVAAIDATFVRVWTLNERTKILELQASAGLYTNLNGRYSRIPLGEYKIGYIAETGERQVTNNLAEDPRIVEPEWAHQEGIVGFVGYPLLIEGHVVGVMATFARRPFTAEDIQALGAVANKVALTIERKHAEQSLRESEERFRLALESSPITVYTTDADLRYTWVFNPPHQLRSEDMLGKRDDEIYTPDGARELLQFKREVFTAGRLSRRVIEVAHRQGYVRFDLSAMPLYNGDGTPIGLTVSAADITERERAETRLAFLAEASELLTASLDYNETLTRLAQALVPQLANWCAVDLVTAHGTHLEQVVIAHEDPEMVWWARELREKYPPNLEEGVGVAQVIRSGRPEFYPYLSEELLKRAARDEEHYRAIQQVGMRSAMIVPLRLRERVLGTITMVWSDSQRNYTEADLRFAEELARRAAVAIENARLYQDARHAEAELRGMNENLEELVHERTAELERSNQELDRFAYVASHDLKAPLRAIEHLASWIEEDTGGTLPEASVDYLRKMRGRIDRMESLLDDLLTYSRAGRVHGEVDWVDLGELLHGVIETVAPSEGFDIQIPDSLPRLRTYRVPLETVFRNLIGNAIKHHPSQQGRIEIGFIEHERQYEFFVSDDGEGIRPEFHGRIFEMFQTLRPRDHIEGSGIGLAVVKKIVESAGGAIRVESNSEKGATFLFTWPKAWGG